MTEAQHRFRQTLTEGIETLALHLPEGAVDQLTQHYQLLVRWARRMNLTTVTDPAEAAVKHAIDCLLFAELIPTSPGLDAVDVGSGAGFPGLVLAVARPQLRLTLLEPLQKRSSFLRVAVAELRLSNARVLVGKLTEAVSGPWPTDLIVSRATIPPLDLVRLAAAKLRPGGRLILTGGRGLPPVEAVIARAAQVGLAHVERRSFVLPDASPRWLDALERPGDALSHE